MRADALPAITSPAIVCIQAGNVNTGAFDPAARSAPGRMTRAHGCMWMARSASGRRQPPARAHLVAGFAEADSWATDAHKYLNSPYDCGLAFVRDADATAKRDGRHRRLSTSEEQRDPMHYTPESSRARAWRRGMGGAQNAGARGLADLVERCCRHATRFAEGLRAAGYDVLNEVDAQSGVGRFWRRRNDPPRHRRRAARTALLVRRHSLAGPRRHAHQRLLLRHHRGRCRAQPRRHHPPRQRATIARPDTDFGYNRGEIRIALPHRLSASDSPLPARGGG